LIEYFTVFTCALFARVQIVIINASTLIVFIPQFYCFLGNVSFFVPNGHFYVLNVFTNNLIGIPFSLSARRGNENIDRAERSIGKA